MNWQSSHLSSGAGLSPIACDLGTSRGQLVRGAIATQDGVSSGLDAVARAMASPNPKVFHNAVFDLRLLNQAGIKWEGPIFDTMHAFHMLQPLLPKTLETVVSIFLDTQRWKDGDRDLSVVRDAQATLGLYQILRDKLAVSEQLTCFENIMRCLPLLLGWEYSYSYGDTKGAFICEAPDPRKRTINRSYLDGSSLFAIAKTLQASGGAVWSMAHPMGACAALTRYVLGPTGESGASHRDHSEDDLLGLPVDGTHDGDLPAQGRAGFLRDVPDTPGPREIKAWRLSYAPLFEWIQENGTNCQRNGFARNPYGRRVECVGWGRRKIVRWLCESTIYDRIWANLPMAAKMVEDLGGRFYAVTQTEIMFIAPARTGNEQKAALIVDSMLGGAENAACSSPREPGPI